MSIPLVLAVCAFVLPPQYGETFMGELKHKVERLASAEGKRLVVVGGSGVAFGQLSERIEEELPGYTVVNFGMYAALGTKAMLELSAPLLREGDIVIVSPEENSQTLSDYFNAEMMWQGADGAFGLLADLDRADAGRLAGRFPYFAASKLYYALTGSPKSEGIYCRASFNGYGDVGTGERACNIMPGLYDTTMPVRLTADSVGEGFFSMLNSYAVGAAERGAAVYYRFCPVNRLAVTEGNADEFYDYLAEHLEFPILGDPNRSVMDPEWFYDTNFHLNAAGAAVNTRALVRDLKAQLGDSSPTEIELPEKPEPQAAAELFGDDSMAEWFLYASGPEGLTVVGAVPGAPDRLIVPTHADGQRVYAIESLSCEAGELVIQESVAAIADGAFAGCPNLRRIVLTGGEPSRTQVGQGLLEGCGADLYVPREAVSAYKLSYFWSQYAQRIVGYGG